MEDGQSTEAEPEDSDEELNVHNFLADLEAELELSQAREAELDHTDGFAAGSPADAEEMEAGAGSEEELEEPAHAEGSSDEEMPDEEEEPPPRPPRPRLNGKQPAPAAYQGPPAAERPKQVLKKPGVLKRPSARGKWPNELCRNYRGEACRFDPQNPGQPAGVHRNRRVYRCIFCDPERMREAHALPRQAKEEEDTPQRCLYQCNLYRYIYKHIQIKMYRDLKSLLYALVSP